MPVAMHIPPSNARLIQVIHVAASRGDGSERNPERIIDLYFRPDGTLLACYDPLNGPPDSFHGGPGPAITFPADSQVTEEAQIG